jgi:hypothetical protein
MRRRRGVFQAAQRSIAWMRHSDQPDMTSKAE